MKTKKGQLEMEEIVKLILILFAIALVVVGIYLLRDKFSSLFDNLKTFLRFGR